MDSGSPIAARLELNIFALLIIAIIMLVLIVVLWLISLKVEKYKIYADYVEKNKNKPAKRKEINEIARRARFSKNEKDLFCELCASHPLPNINYVLTRTTDFDTYLKNKFKEFNSQKNEDGMAVLFSLRAKIYNTFESTEIIKSTRLIPMDTSFTFTPSRGVHHIFILVDANPQELHFQLPINIPPEEKPEILSKIKLIFIYKDNTPYEIEARVVRYQKGKNNADLLVCAQTDRIVSRTKRAYPRLELFQVCRFSSVKAETKDKKTEYKVSEKQHEGNLLDISAGGCRISTKLPIKAEQYIHINSNFGIEEEKQAIGLILRTSKTKNEEFILHIKFVKIEKHALNQINALTSGYIS